MPHQIVMSAFSSPGFMPHGHCYLWTPSLLMTFVTADALIALSYYSIPLGLLYFVGRRKDLRFNWMFKLFSLFIFACGTSHVMAIWTIWHPDYWLDAGVKAVTAVVSLITATLLWPLIPRAIKLPSTRQLEQLVAQLGLEVEQRAAAEAELSRLKNVSESRFHELFDRVSVGVIEVDFLARRILRVNKKYCQIMGYASDELLDPNFSIATLVDDSWEGLMKAAARYERADEVTMEMRCLRKDGQTIWMNINASRLSEVEQSERTYLVIVKDISQRKAAEETLRKQYVELKRWQQLTVGRETRVLELKDEVNQLLARAGEPPRYATATAGLADG